MWIRGFDLQSHPLWNQIAAAIGSQPSIAMDGQDNFLLTWTAYPQNDDNDPTGGFSAGVYGIMAQLEDYATGTPLALPAVTRSLFRLNGASTAPTSVTNWPLFQGDSAAAVDLDGDLAVAYDGFGSDVSTSPSITPSLFEPYFNPVNGNPTTNTDLLPYFNPFAGNTLVFGSPFLYATEPEFTIDQAIDQVLFNAEYASTPAATHEQLGRLRYILEERGRPDQGRGIGGDAVAVGRRFAIHA